MLENENLDKKNKKQSNLEVIQKYKEEIKNLNKDKDNYINEINKLKGIIEENKKDNNNINKSQNNKKGE